MKHPEGTKSKNLVFDYAIQIQDLLKTVIN